MTNLPVRSRLLGRCSVVVSRRTTLSRGLSTKQMEKCRQGYLFPFYHEGPVIHLAYRLNAATSSVRAPLVGWYVSMQPSLFNFGDRGYRGLFGFALSASFLRPQVTITGLKSLKSFDYKKEALLKSPWRGDSRLTLGVCISWHTNMGSSKWSPLFQGEARDKGAIWSTICSTVTSTCGASRRTC